MLSKVKLLLSILTLLICICSCTKQHANITHFQNLTDQQKDSLFFLYKYHYTINYNFYVVADSLQLSKILPNEQEIFAPTNTNTVVYHGDKLVVASIQGVTNDSTQQKDFYVKVARDQFTMGWVSEKELKQHIVPCDPISQFIHTFSNNYIYGFCIIIAIALLYFIYRLKKHQHIPLVHFQDIDSIYPGLLCVITAFAAMLYGIMQKYFPYVWETFYYDPSLNPIGQPNILSLFLVCVWMSVILFIATLDEVHKQLSHSEAIMYLLSLACVWFMLYVVYSQGIHIYISYPLFIIYLCFAWHQYRKHHIAPYLCGQCGSPLHQLGKCPHCGCVNK